MSNKDVNEGGAVSEGIPLVPNKSTHEPSNTSKPKPSSFAKSFARFIVINGVFLSLMYWFVYAFGLRTDIVDLILAINWIVGIVAIIFNTEKFFDLTGSLTFISVVCLTFTEHVQPKNPHNSLRQGINSALVLLWAIRLGSYLFTRISQDGKDGRFDEIKLNKLRFFTAWTFQSTWVFFSVLPLVLLNSTRDTPDINAMDYIGWAVWTNGFLLEVLADRQKARFRANPANKNRFITTGLWAYSRHPNYVGEILVWTGVCISCSNAWTVHAHYLSVISPLFVYFILTRVSGIPMLEKAADEKWGNDEKYLEYKEKTPILWFRFSKISPLMKKKLKKSQ